jgi:hypothetical protein
VVEHRFVAAHAGEVVDVARLRHADDGVDEEVRLRLLGRAEGQLLMRAVERVAGLEGDDAAPAELAEIGAEFVRRVAAGLEVVVDGRLDAGHRAAEVDRPRLVVEVVDRRMGEVVGAVDVPGLAVLVRTPFVGDRQDGEDHAFRVAERDVLPGLDLVGEGLGDVERDGHGPERAVRHPHVLDHAVVVRLGQEALERMEAAVHQEFEIAHLPLREVP